MFRVLIQFQFLPERGEGDCFFHFETYISESKAITVKNQLLKRYAKTLANVVIEKTDLPRITSTKEKK